MAVSKSITKKNALLIRLVSSFRFEKNFINIRICSILKYYSEKYEYKVFEKISRYFHVLDTPI